MGPDDGVQHAELLVLSTARNSKTQKTQREIVTKILFKIWYAYISAKKELLDLQTLSIVQMSKSLENRAFWKMDQFPFSGE
jgi:hypothetical protein